MNLAQINRVVHRWASILITLPLLLVILTGILLMLKKDFAWIQPESARGSGTVPVIGFDRILREASTVEQAQIQSWEDVDRLDVRPSKGIVKVRAENRWEIQIDTETAEILQVAYRRSDLIESLHDGSFYGDTVKKWIFLPSAVVLLIVLLSGVYLFGLYVYVTLVQ